MLPSAPSDPQSNRIECTDAARYSRQKPDFTRLRASDGEHEFNVIHPCGLNGQRRSLSDVLYTAPFFQRNGPCAHRAIGFSLEECPSDSVSTLDAETLNMLPLTILSFRDDPLPACVTEQYLARDRVPGRSGGRVSLSRMNAFTGIPAEAGIKATVSPMRPERPSPPP